MTKIYAVPQPKFPLGGLYVTTAADLKVAPLDIGNCLRCHARGDWGEVSAEDRRENDAAIGSGGRLHSVYHDRKGVEFWIITESDRSVTTVLLPDDY